MSGGFLAMPWYALGPLLIVVLWATSVKSVLAFTFFAIVSFVLAQNLLDTRAEYDLFRLLGCNNQRNDTPSEDSTFPRSLVGCRQTLIKYILRDFVISWFENVGIGEQFVLETRTVLEEVTESLHEKLVCTDVTSYSTNFCIILHKHFIAFKAVKNREIFKSGEETFQAYKSFKKRSYVTKQDELKYLRSVVDLLLEKLIKKQTLNCNAGRFILREILAVSLLLPILDKLSEPHFLNKSIINIFGETKLPDTCGEIPDETNFDSSESVLMRCLDQHDRSKTGCKITDSETTVKYKIKDRTIIEHDHKEHVEISMEPLCTKTKQNTFSNCFKENSTEPEFGHGNEKKLEHSENSSKPLEIFGVRFQPGSFVFGMNLKKFQPPSIIKRFGVLRRSSDDQDSLMKQKDEAKSSISPDLHVALNQKGVQKDQIPCARNSHHADSELSHRLLNKEIISSSFEDINGSDFLCPNKDRLEVEQSEMKYCTVQHVPEDEGYGLLDNENISKDNQRSSDSSIHDDRLLRKSLSSSGEEWESDVFDNFMTEDNGIQDVQELGDMDGKQICEKNVSCKLAVAKSENPCFLINIVSTELIADGTWEPHKSKYTVYHISYSNKLWSSSSSEDDETTDDIINIKRRYREFMELHHRLSNGPHASCLKDVPKPNRKFNSPFFRLDEDVIEGRQHLLETYLKALVTHPNILNSDEFKGFLGIGDEGQTTFHRQLPFPAVPRIDKKLQKKVTKIIDHIKTAFETGPFDGDKQEELMDDIREVLGDDKLSPDNIRTFAICSTCCRLSHSCCSSDKQFQSFVEEKQNNGTEILELRAMTTNKHSKPHKNIQPGINAKQSDGTVHKSSTSPNKSCKTSKNCPTSTPVQNQKKSFLLTRTIFNLSCELLQDQASWVCLDPVQQAVTTLFGCLFEWWFESLICELITEEQWQYYLNLLKKTVWASGKLMEEFSGEESTDEEKEKVKEDAVKTLSGFFGGVLHVAIGSDVIEATARNIVESFQCEEINRQLLFEVLEVTMVEVFPEIDK